VHQHQEEEGIMKVNGLACLSGAFGLAAAMSVSSVGLADGPAVTLSVNGNVSSLSGTATAASNVYNYTGSLTDGGGMWTTGFDFNASNMADMQTSFVSGNFVVINTGSMAQDFEIVLTLPVVVTGSKMTMYGGSVAGSVIGDADGGFFGTTGSNPVWSASTDGMVIADLLTAPINISTNPFQSALVGSASFGEPIPSAPGPNLTDSLEITLRFTLGAGDSAAFTSIFVAQVPAPGAVALLGLAGLVGSRRRRG
jgi:MYXO-CTERM domain-containing protein